jgi:hypothetical protein
VHSNVQQMRKPVYWVDWRICWGYIYMYTTSVDLQSTPMCPRANGLYTGCRTWPDTFVDRQPIHQHWECMLSYIQNIYLSLPLNFIFCGKKSKSNASLSEYSFAKTVINVKRLSSWHTRLESLADGSIEMGQWQPTTDKLNRLRQLDSSQNFANHCR